MSTLHNTVISLTHHFFILFRGALCVPFLLSGKPSAIVFGISEVLAVALSAYGAIGKPKAGGWGLLTPFCYMMPLFFVANGTGAKPAGLMLILACAVQIVLRLRMGPCISVGIPFCNRVITGWPYSIIRHPLGATEMVIAVAFVAAHPSAWNAFVCVLAIGGAYAAAKLEEGFLLRVSPEYRLYAGRVRNRFIP